MSPADTPAAASWAGRRVAVSGATGFVGYQLCMTLSAAGARLTTLVRASSNTTRLCALGAHVAVAPLDDADSMTRALAGHDVLFHLAGAVDFNNDWEHCRRVNVDGTTTILRSAARAGIPRIVHASSIVAVGASWEPRRL